MNTQEFMDFESLQKAAKEVEEYFNQPKPILPSPEFMAELPEHEADYIFNKVEEYEVMCDAQKYGLEIEAWYLLHHGVNPIDVYSELDL